MARHSDTYRGFRFIVDAVDGGKGRWRYESTVDGKKTLIGEACSSESEAREQGIKAAQDKIDEVLRAYGR